MNPVALLVEDAPDLRAVMTACLRQMGFDVVALRDGESAFDTARESQPMLVCLDLVLPNVGGLEVCERLKRSPETAHIPVVITSARTSPQDRATAERLGADDYFTKPITPRVFIDRVRELLERRAEACA